MNAKQLYEQILKKKSFLCVGLDSDLAKIPQHLKEKENPVFEFNKKIIDATAKYTVAYKLNLAFYECKGAEGWTELERTVKYIRENYPEIFIIADAKRGDIGNTAKMYAQAFFEQMNFDAVTLSPYMGKDSVKPFTDYPNKWAVLLGLTSNKSAGDFQYFTNEKTGETLFENVLQKSKNWASENQLMYVVGATKAEKLKEIRKIIPDHFLLVPGVGAQGGSLEEVAKYGMNEQCGLLVNSSRGIIFADNSRNFDKAAEKKAEELQKEMANLLNL